MKRLTFGLTVGIWLAGIAPPPQSVLPFRDRAPAVNRILEERLESVLPAAMREAGLDMWLVINREYAEDPVYLTLVPEPVFAARRTTMLVFHDRGPDEGVERMTVSRYPIKGVYDSVWEGGSLDEQWERLTELIVEKNPERIGINVSRDWPLADGLTASLEAKLREMLPQPFAKRLTSAEQLVVRWLETRTESELQSYPNAVGLARSVIAEAFSNRVITPGVTTPDDVAWYIRERFEELGLRPWFQPYVNIQRRGLDHELDAPFYGTEEGPILRGDVLHTDVGICYLRMCTDTQEMGYVLHAGEQSPPAGLVRAMEIGNRWQELLTAEFENERTGNEILAATSARAETEGIRSSTYSHPIGFNGHAAGPTIGMWDNQGPTPIRGDWPLHPNTAYAIEGNIKAPVPQWDDQTVQIKLEQSAVWNGREVIYLAGRQTRWHLVR